MLYKIFERGPAGDRGLCRRGRGRHRRRPAQLHRRRPARRLGPREQGAGQGGPQEQRLRFPAAPGDGQPGPGRPAQGGAGLRSAHRPGPSGLSGRDPGRSRFRGYLFMGELALDGRLKPVKGVLSAALLAKQQADSGPSSCPGPTPGRPPSSRAGCLRPGRSRSRSCSFCGGDAGIAPCVFDPASHGSSRRRAGPSISATSRASSTSSGPWRWPRPAPTTS